MMKIRILEDTLREIRGDLCRPHPHARERVGFAFVRPSGDSALVITGYQAIPDEYYLVDKTVGARISHKAIAQAMKRADHQNEGILHVHSHGGRGIPRFSRTDLQSHDDFLRSFQSANPQGIHGFLLLSEDSMLTRVWRPEQSNFHDICQYSIVGVQSTHHWSEVKHYKQYNNRQSFLGDNLDDILENCVVGVVGLGGGGSQVVQQLAHIGFKQYVLCDFDMIEETNLNRLVGGTINDVDLGASKMSIAVRMIRGLQPDAVIHKVIERFQDDSEALKRCDIIFGCLDGFLNRDQLEKLARSAFIPYIDIGMDVRRPEDEPPRMSGQVIASVPGKPCMGCYSFITEKTLAEEARKYGDTGIRPQVVWPNGILASTAIHIALNLLTNWTNDAEQQTLYYEYDGNKGEIKPHLFFERQLNKPCNHYLQEHAGDRKL